MPTNSPFDSFPIELRLLKRWCAWKYVKRGEKWSKHPLQPNGCMAESDNEKTWSTYDEVIAVHSKFDGIGVFFAPPYAGVDIDDCVTKEKDGNLTIDPLAQTIIRNFATYAEFSPSCFKQDEEKGGVKLWLKGKLPPKPPGKKEKLSHLEVYDHGRYFAVTGQRVPGTPETINPAQDCLNDFYQKMDELNDQLAGMKPQAEVVPTTRSPREKIVMLAQGRWKDAGYPSQSEGDAAYCHYLAEIYKGDAQKIDAEFRRSPLMREKWDKVHVEGKKYGEAIIGKVLKTFKPKASRYDGDGSDWREHFESGEQMGDNPLKFISENFWAEESMCVISGLVGHGKTWAALDISRSLWKRLPIFGHFAVPEIVPVLYLTPEVGRAALKHRMKFYGLHEAGDWFLTRTLSQGPTLGLNDARIICAARGRVIVLDTIHRFTRGDENAASDASKFGDACLNLIAQGCRGILGLGHSSKAFGGADTMTAENCLRGSSEFGGIIGSMFAFKRLDEELLKIHVECVKPRDFEGPKPFQLQGRPHISDGRGYVMTAKPGDCGYLRDAQKGSKQKIHPKQEEILAMLAEGKHTREIEEKLHVSPKTVTNVRRLLKSAKSEEPPAEEPQDEIPF